MPRRVELDDLLIRKAKSELKRAIRLWDAQLPGLCVVIQPTGHKAFKAVYSNGKKACWYHIGRYPTVGLADARKIARKILLKVVNGEDPHRERMAAKERSHEDANTEAEIAAVRAFMADAQPSLLPANARWSTVYFAAIGRAIKVGVTTDLEKRLKSLQAGVGEKIKLVAALPGDRELERQFHQALADAHISGEFFRTAPVMEFLIDIGLRLYATANTVELRPLPVVEDRRRPPSGDAGTTAAE
jgi:hypothetical protein